MKKLTVILAAAVMMFTTAGCSQQDESSSDSSSAPESSSVSSGTETSSAEEASSQPDVSEPAPKVDMLDVKPKQTVNETPASYASLGVDADKKQEFIKKHIKEKGLPVVNITTKDNKEYILSRDEYTSCVVDIFGCDEKYVISEASAGVKVRGNSSAYYGKESDIKRNTVPYRIKFDEKTSVLGLNGGAQCRSWVLLKSDWDLIRNDIALRFGRAIIGNDTFCSDGQLVLLYVNDKYQDIYLMCEQCQVNKERVDITEPAEGYTGNDIGYYFEIDNYAYDEADPLFFEMDYGGHVVTDVRGTTKEFVPAEYSVKSDIYTVQQMEFIKKYMNNLFELVYLACEKGRYKTFDENYDLIDASFTSAEETVGAVMDLDSVVDLYLLYELVHDYDCGEGSFFMCIDFSPDSTHKKLEFTSPWDFNWAYNDSTSRHWAAAFSEDKFIKQYGDRTNPWLVVLGKQEWFQKLASEKWTALNKAGAIRKVIDDETSLLGTFNDDLNKTNEWAVGCSFDLLKWIEKRIKWMDKTFTV
ncbi:MAG: CotH kinase family protein [Ruminococcus sp.]|nr:CotH kinase family protein [Ruminococcus sp.]